MITHPVNEVPPEIDGNAADLRRLASEREGRINDLTEKVGLLELRLSVEQRTREQAEDSAYAAQQALRRLRKVLKNAYLTALEAGK